MPVTVEGIEDAATHAAVAGFGCAVGQGWYFGKPMSGDQATRPASVAPWRRYRRPLLRPPQRLTFKVRK